MKLLKIVLITTLLSGLIVVTTGCSQGNSTESQEQLTANVTRGDLAFDVSAVGNLAFSQKDNLTFEISGTITDVLVEEGDLVDEGQVLAKLDESAKTDLLDTLDNTIEQKDQALLQAQINLDNAQAALDALNDPTNTDLKTAQAELNVYNMQIALEAAQDAYDAAEERYNNNWTVPENIRNYEMAGLKLQIAQLNLTEAQDAVGQILIDLEAQKESKQQDLDLVQKKFTDAQNAYDAAVAEKDDAVIQSYEITAPYAGYITKINITEGQQVQKNASAIVMADPNLFEASVMVGETDISNVHVGSQATVQVDSMSVILPAEVTYISPTATISSGVVNYSVKVKLLSTNVSSSSFTQGFGSGLQGSIQDSVADLAPGELPANLQQAVDAGRMTQQQAEALVKAMQSGNFTGRGGFNTGGFGGTGSTDQLPQRVQSGNATAGGFFGGTAPSGAFGTTGQIVTTTSSSDTKLREGMTITISIVTETRTNVLLVPSTAITTQNGQSTVTIVNSDGSLEQRVITTDLSDWQNTEVLSGLSEGEIVVVPVATVTTTDNTQNGISFRSFGGGAAISGGPAR